MAGPEGMEVVQGLIVGKWLARAVGVAAKLGVADRLAGGPRACRELAGELGVDEGALRRVLRALASQGVFREVEEGKFGLTPAAGFLRTGVEGSLKAVAVMAAEEWTWRPWGEMDEAVRTGKPTFEKTMGAPAFEYLAREPEAARVFDEAMTGWSMHNSRAVAAAYDFSGIKTLMDVGGGHGFLLATILKANPGMKGVLYETAEVCVGGRELMAREGLAGRCEVVEGNFFESVPAGADAYILKSVIHDWDDERATAILRHCAGAVGGGGKVLLAEMVVPAGNDPHLSKLLDLEMLVMAGGKERTEEEFRALLAGAGLGLASVVPTASPTCVVEAVAG